VGWVGVLANRKFPLSVAAACSRTDAHAGLIGEQIIQNLIAVPPVQVLSRVPGK
jgi:hypothetical protein